MPSDEIHVWLVYHDGISDERLHSAYRQLLDGAEEEKARQFHFDRDRRQYVVTRALVRTVLSRYSPIRPRDWKFSMNMYGRPDVANPEAKGGGVCFNLSHTRGLIALGVTKCRALGVDVENVRTRNISIAIADRYFAPGEVAALTAADENERQYRFFEYWTLKESYIKARGMGLSLPLERFSFHYPDEKGVEITIDAELGDDAARWQFWQLRPTSDHLVAICAERVGAGAPRVVVRESIPMLREEECDANVSRTSGNAIPRPNPPT